MASLWNARVRRGGARVFCAGEGLSAVEFEVELYVRNWRCDARGR